MEERRPASPFRLALFWFGIQAVWGALLGISLQARTSEFSPANAQVTTNELATGGAAVAAIVQILVGLWADSRRRQRSRRIEFYLFGALGGTAALLGFYGAGNLAALAVAFVALQATLNVAIGPYQAIIPDFVGPKRFGIASSWMAALQSAGNAMGALCASFIANARVLGAALSALLLATCALTATHIRRLPLFESPESQERLRITRPFVDLFISRALVYVGFYTLLFNLFFYVRNVLGAPTIAGGSRLTGILILCFTVVGTFGAAVASRPSDRVDKRLVATLGAVAFIAALAIFIVAHGTATVVVATVIAGIGWGIFLVADWAIACRVLPSGAMASAMGIWNLAIVVPQIVAPALTTFVLSRTAAVGSAGPRIAFTMALIETLVGIAWLWRLSRSSIGE